MCKNRSNKIVRKKLFLALLYEVGISWSFRKETRERERDRGWGGGGVEEKKKISLFNPFKLGAQNVLWHLRKN
jgi:hypothetical protein